MLRLILFCAAICAVIAQTPQERAREIIKQMTLDEKISMVHGYGWGPYAGTIKAIPRLKVPGLYLLDGPQGPADGVTKVTCWPSTLTVVASWDLDLMRQYGEALGKEQLTKGTNIMLGPMVNIARVAHGGRNFESFGEDPLLASKLVVPYIEGVQSQGVMATVKHWVLNNQEYNRSSISASADERTSFEIYYPPFRAAVDAGVYAVMCSYNKVNGTYACENDAALNRDLKQRMGFKGLVMSDWGATHSTELAANSGLDMEQPDAKFFGETLKQAVTSGKVPKNRLDDMIKRILVPMFQVGIFDHPRTGNATKDAQSEEHVKLAKQLSEASTVLLQNNGILPLNADTIKKIAVIGMDAGPQTIVAGRGSGHVIPPYTVTPLKGITNRVPKAQVTYSDGQSLQDAARTAKDADVAIVFIATDSGEGKDRVDLTFGNQDQLVQTIAMAQPNTIVVAHAPGSVLMPWSENVKAILCAFLPGQESGNAIASVLFGDVNPSARLPLTFPASATQLPLKTREQYPGVNGVATYTEKLLVGYRWYDDQKEIPRFAFGHGLSYTNFIYSNLEVLASQCGGHVRVLVNITNTGKVSGAEIAQLYLGYPKEAGEPPQVLRGFKKVFLKPGESQRIEFDSLEQEKDLSIWDVVEGQWKIIKGTWKVFVGASSRDIRAESGFINMDNC